MFHSNFIHNKKNTDHEEVENVSNLNRKIRLVAEKSAGRLERGWPLGKRLAAQNEASRLGLGISPEAGHLA